MLSSDVAMTLLVWALNACTVNGEYCVAQMKISVRK